MHRLLEFVRSTYVIILFVIAEAVAVGHYAFSSSYTRAKIFVVTNSVVAGVSGVFHNTIHLFALPAENRELAGRIAQLELEKDDLLAAVAELPAEDQITFSDPDYSYVVARVVSNSINKHDNYIVVDCGMVDGVREKMAAITPTGEMVGYVEACTDRYSAVLSILSDSFTTSGKVKGGSNYGSVSWNRGSRYGVSMSELSKYEAIEVGDTIVSTGFSQIFPGGVTIGRVASFEFNEMRTAYNVEIDLAAHITAVDYLLLVGNNNQSEVEELMNIVE